MSYRIYRDFILLASNVKKNRQGVASKFDILVFDSPLGQGEEPETVSIPSDLVKRLRELENRQLEQEIAAQIELGEDLAALLLPPYARDLFLSCLNSLDEGEGLRLRLRLADELVDFPWEYLYLHPHRGEKTAEAFLALDPRISIVRDMPVSTPPEVASPTNCLHILCAMASPAPYQQYPRLDSLPGEQQALKEMLREVKGVRFQFLPEYDGQDVEQVPGASLPALTAALFAQERTDIFHFSGHGEFVRDIGPAFGSILGEGRLILADEHNQASPIPAYRLGELLRGQGVQLVVLGACQSGRRDGHNVWSSVAASMLKARIPAVVAMQFTVRDSLAAAFSASFYRALLAGYPVDYAVAAGRAAMRSRMTGDLVYGLDWGVPVLYLRPGDGLIFQPIGDSKARRAAEKELDRLPVHLDIRQHFGDVIHGVKQVVDTQGGAFISGNITVGGDFVVRDKVVFGDEVHGDKVGGDKIEIRLGENDAPVGDLTPLDVAALFTAAQRQLSHRPEQADIDKAELSDLLEKIQNEWGKGRSANRQKLHRWMEALSAWAPDVARVLKPLDI